MLAAGPGKEPRALTENFLTMRIPAAVLQRTCTRWPCMASIVPSKRCSHCRTSAEEASEMRSSSLHCPWMDASTNGPDESPCLPCPDRCQTISRFTGDFNLPASFRLIRALRMESRPEPFGFADWIPDGDDGAQSLAGTGSNSR